MISKIICNYSVGSTLRGVLAKNFRDKMQRLLRAENADVPDTFLGSVKKGYWGSLRN